MEWGGTIVDFEDADQGKREAMQFFFIQAQSSGKQR